MSRSPHGRERLLENGHCIAQHRKREADERALAICCVGGQAEEIDISQSLLEKAFSVFEEA
jgi:hypothetical protein